MSLVVEITNAKFFKAPLARVHHALSKNIPIQKCILLEARPGEGLFLTGLDTRTHQLTLRVPDAEVFEEGMALVDGNLLWELAATLDDAALSIAVDEQDAELVLQAGGRRLKVSLFGEDPSVFKALMETMPDTVAQLDAEELADIIKGSLKLTNKSSFVTIAGKDGDVFVYTMIRNRCFSQARMENRLDSDPWSIGVQMEYLGKVPPFVGDAEVHLDKERGIFAISVGDEHILIRQTQEDAIMAEIDTLMAKTADGYWVAKQDSLMSDLKAAMAIKDKAGVGLEVQGNGLFVSCAAKGRGSVKNTHMLVDCLSPVDEEGKDLKIKLHFDPQMLQKAFESIGGVDVCAEILTEVMEAWDEDEEDEVFHNLRFMDQDKPDARKIVVASQSGQD